MTLAPWLRPTDTLGAIRSGASLGLQLRQQGAQEEQAAAALRQREDEMFAQNERAKAQMALESGHYADLRSNQDREFKFRMDQAAKGDLDAAEALKGMGLAYGAFGQQAAPMAPTTSLSPVMVPGRIPPNETPDPNPADMVPIPGQEPVNAAAALAPRSGGFPDVSGLRGPAARAFAESYPQVMAMREREATARLSNDRMATQAEQAHLDRLAAISGRKETTEMNNRSRESVGAGKPATLNVGERTLVSNYGRSVANKELAKAQIEDKLVTLEDESIPYPVRYASAQELYKTLNSTDFGRDALQEAEAKRIGQLLEVTGPVQWIKSGKKPLPDWNGFIQQIKIKSANLEKETGVLKAQMDGIQSAAEKRRGDASGTVGGATGGPARVNTQSEYDALQKGTRYVDSNGKIATKK